MLEAEARANGGSVAALSPEGKTYLDQLLREDLSLARAEAEARIAHRSALEAATRLNASLRSLVGELQEAVASAAADASSPLSYAEREHQRAIAAQWDAAGY